MRKSINRYPTETEIRQRAHEIFLDRGRQPGREIDDWLQAEYELVQLPVTHLAKLAMPESKGSKLAVANMVQAALLISASGVMPLRYRTGLFYVSLVNQKLSGS